MTPTSARDRLNIAKAKLALFGEPKEGESEERRAEREHYQQMRNQALSEISSTERLPYKDGDD